MRKGTFAVVYRTGGTGRCQWNRVFNSFATVEAARVQCAEIERAGYKALYFDAGQLDRIGMPEGWNATPEAYRQTN